MGCLILVGLLVDVCGCTLRLLCFRICVGLILLLATLYSGLVTCGYRNHSVGSGFVFDSLCAR